MEKPAEDLFFVQNEISNDSVLTGIKWQTRKDTRHRPLKSEINLHPNPAVRGFPSQKRRKVTRKTDLSEQLSRTVDSSSEEEEFDASVSYGVISQEAGKKLVSRLKSHPQKPTVHVAFKDLWEEGTAP